MGAVQRGLLRQGLRYALGLRVVVVAASSTMWLLTGSPPHRAVTVAVVLALNAWNLCYARAMLRGSRRWAVPLDVAVMCGVGLAQTWTVRSDPTGGSTWVLIAVQITVVAYPWQLSWRAMVAATATIVAAYHLGTVLADPGGWLVNDTIPVWTAVEAALSFALYRFVRRSARRADRIVERGEALRRAAAVAAARRADEREYLAALHDTASATLLMVGGGVASAPQGWLSGQAQRDLDVVRGSDDAADGDVDLAELLRDVVRQVPLRVTLSAPASLRLPAVDAVSLSRGAREALTNVVRHAGTDRAAVRVGDDGTTVTVEVSDAGRGFDPARVADHRYGLTRSLAERMARTGGGARIDSSPGHGTTITMTCPRYVPEPAGDDARVIAGSFQRGLRWAVVVMSLAILLLFDLPRILSSGYAYRAAWPQFAAWGGMLAVTAAAAVAAWRDRPLGRWRWPLLAVVFGCSLLATVSTRPQHLLGAEHWSESDAGWQILLVLLDRRGAVVVAVLAAHYLTTWALVALSGQAGLTLAGAVNATWVVLAFQLTVAMIAAVLRELAVSSARVARDDERLRTAEAVARHLHADRTRRYAGLAATTVPLLRGLASGELDPGAEQVRRSCAAEAARMRRLFAEDTAAADPLSHELRACIELAESNGVAVSFATCGTVPELPGPVRRRLTGPAIAALATARGAVRLTVAGTREAVTVSVIARCPPPDATPDGDGVHRSAVPDGDRWWITTTWQGGS